ncbi:Hpt domain-containing protein [Sphingobium ummariense]|uniref:HPt domain-containing protein n=1 Tax=Sphingobium ummariense RL-3 TaxID=1346791 RepID=T0ISQ0_9SPHN|nr:Hpt domain-containing protein [Sphingobium ummariense]EQB31880.1 hypothetical protein M529_12360 [Sphingobium ummariense RL-3]
MAEFDDRMAALRDRFIAQTAQDLERLRAGIPARDWIDVRDICHRLSGRGGMFGFPELGDAARALEESIDRGDALQVLDRLSDQLLAEAERLAQGR